MPILKAVIAGSLLLILIVLSCTDTATPVSPEKGRSKTLAVIDLKYESRIRFVEPEPGELIVDIAVRPTDRMNQTLRLPPPELYRYFTGKEPLEILKNAYAFAMAQGGKNGDNAATAGTEEVFNRDSLPAAHLNKSKDDGSNSIWTPPFPINDQVFSNMACDLEEWFDWRYCWLHASNTSYLRRRIQRGITSQTGNHRHL